MNIKNDVIAKTLQTLFPEEFSVIGEIKERIEPDFSNIERKTIEMDLLLEIKKDELLVIQFESDFQEMKLIDYMIYCNELGMKYPNKDITLYVIHTGNYLSREKKSKIANLELEFTEFYLGDIDGQTVYKDALNAIEEKRALSDSEAFHLMLYPLIDYENRVENMMKVIKLLEQLPISDQGNRILKTMIRITKKFIEKDQKVKVMKYLEMTKIGQEVYDEIKEIW